jgi:hypothetical protein
LDTIEIDRISLLAVRMVLDSRIFVDPIDKDLEPCFLLGPALAFVAT